MPSYKRPFPSQVFSLTRFLTYLHLCWVSSITDQFEVHQVEGSSGLVCCDMACLQKENVYTMRMDTRWNITCAQLYVTDTSCVKCSGPKHRCAFVGLINGTLRYMDREQRNRKSSTSIIGAICQGVEFFASIWCSSHCFISAVIILRLTHCNHRLNISAFLSLDKHIDLISLIWVCRLIHSQLIQVSCGR